MTTKALFVFVMLSLHLLPAQADSCFVFVGEMGAKKGLRPDTDGPGSFGPLHEAMTLSCLEYTELARGSNGVSALLVDFWGREHWVIVGDYVGENSGRIVEITESRISLVQLEPVGNHGYVEKSRYLYRKNQR